MGVRREQVTQAAMRVLVEDGTHGLTHRKVDARAGVPAGTCSNSFPTRIALIRAVLRAFPERDFEFVAWAKEQDVKTAADELLPASMRRLAEYMLGPAQDQVLTWYRMVIDGSSDPEVRAETGKAVAPLRDYYASVLAQCGAADPDTRAVTVLAYVGGLVFVQRVDPLPQFDIDRVLAPFARGLMHVIRRDAAEDAGV